MLRLSNVGTNTRTAAKKLLGKNIFISYISQMLIQLHNSDCEPKTFLFNYVIHILIFNFQLSIFNLK